MRMINIQHTKLETRGVSHTLALPFTLKSILRQKKNYGNSNISPCKNIYNLQKIYYIEIKGFGLL